ncbi:MAG: hypothetical protein E3J36_02605 [Candidatus Nealsonbacteria bacterium]|nr:MAG: hypothetical protein E3J36_02605 [Candidatus Nealsonbacteria bacterium]
MEKFFNNLIEVNLLLKNIDFVFFKTIFPNYSYLPSDIDILIQDKENFDTVYKIFLNSNFKEIKEVQPFKFRFVKDFQVDLYQKISWGGISFLDNVKKRTIKFKEASFPVPVKEDEFLIILAHSFFTMKKIDKFWVEYLIGLLKDLDKNKLIERAKKFGWEDAVNFFLENKEIKKSNIFLIKKLKFDFIHNKEFHKEILNYLKWRFNSFLWKISKR